MTMNPLALVSHDTTENLTFGETDSRSLACVLVNVHLSARINVVSSRINSTLPVLSTSRRPCRNRFSCFIVSMPGISLVAHLRINQIDSMSDMSELMLHLQKIKRIDMRIAVDVAGIANVAVRDANGNLLPIVWTRQSVSNEYDNATLLTCDTLQKHLQTFIDAGVKENIDILQKVEDPTLLVDWVVRTAEYWEKRYTAKCPEKYDISQTVFSAMFETLGIEKVYESMLMVGFQKVENKLQQNLDELRHGKNKYH